MSDCEESFCFFGRPLEPYDEDSIPKKRPISVEEQIATDAQGRRRFHGAFTGGFSAGFYNTVGSLEGWLPGEFKSSRQERIDKNETQQKPEDYMDEEDFSEFGIAHQTVRATSDYCTSKKRKKQVFSDGPIPGEPVLHSLLTSGNETIGYLLLKNMALKDRKQQIEDDNDEEEKAKVYGCVMPKVCSQINDENELMTDQYEIPAIYKEFLTKPKSNTFGLDYKGLSDEICHLNLFQTSKLVINEKNKRKLEISGQAFGVGAFEDDDEDIYVKDDMTKYDFEITNEKIKKGKSKANERLIFDDFVGAKKCSSIGKSNDFPALPTIPHSFIGKHKIKKSRFEPLIEPTNKEEERKNINPILRAKYLGEVINENVTISKSNKSQNNKVVNEQVQKNQMNVNSLLVFDRFIAASQSEDINNLLEPVKNTSENIHGTEEMRNAVKMKMFGPLTRIQFDWIPSSLLCKRFNVPEPNKVGDKQTMTSRKRTRNLIFQYEESQQDNANIMKPGLSLPKTIEKEANISNEEEKTETPPVNVPEIETESNENVDMTEKLDISENVDLFKSIFLSSDEESDNTIEESNKSEEKINLLKSSVLSDNFLPKIKPIKQGLLSNVDFSIFANSNKKITENIQEEEKVEQIPLYGPKLPTEKMQNQFDKTMINEDDNNEWVEKHEGEKHKKHHKHKKNHKKHKKSKKHK